MSIEIISYTYRNPDIHTAYHTHRMHLDELIAYIMGEKLLLGISGECELDGVIIDYINSSLHPLDRPSVFLIYSEIRDRVGKLSADYIYQSLLLSGEFYLKYDYYVSKQFTKLQLYVDPSESSWTLW